MGVGVWDPFGVAKGDPSKPKGVLVGVGGTHPKGVFVEVGVSGAT